jgi:hypothetical protein
MHVFLVTTLNQTAQVFWGHPILQVNRHIVYQHLQTTNLMAYFRNTTD